jgi:hypothetical protein
LRITAEVAASSDRLIVQYFLEPLAQIDLVTSPPAQVRS